MSIGIRGETRNEADYMTIGEVARRFRCSPDTIRRQRIADKLQGIEWVDLFQNGRVRAKRKTVEDFIARAEEATRKIYSQSIQKSRPS